MDGKNIFRESLQEPEKSPIKRTLFGDFGVVRQWLMRR